MKIGIVSDIHGNHYSLSAVLAEMRKLDVERLFVLGDLVGYYYQPQKVFDMLAGWSPEMIQGNHEQMLLDSMGNPAMAADIKKRFGSGISVGLERLGAKEIGIIRTLPESREVEVDGLLIKLCHGAPWNQNQYIYPDSPEELFGRCLAYEADFIFLGHSHYPFVTCRDNVVIANPGSVGQSRDKGGRASWLVLDTVNRTLAFQHTSYDVEPLLKEVMRHDPGNTYLAEVLVR
ncbi:MAG: metallophosphatase family protein [Proteobacteria bacterium]|nr:metallophosphatase family protein [Pseudomonadota bacterium]MBU1715791.1 metallophosphatase family protein [Pseudomonadota bacterium]